jgi:peptidoglycan/xylan/chitin deacetylase (PgdA/CDA1 family)
MQFLCHFKLQQSKNIALFLLSFFMLTLNFPAPSLDAQNLPAEQKDSLAVLCYHHIVPEESPINTNAIISVSEFEQQMKYLYEHGYYTAKLNDIEEFLYTKKALPENTVLITFDDGYESNYTYAYPILKKYGLNALIFLIGGSIESKPQDLKIIPKLSFDQIREMTDSGLIEFGSHTFNAHYLINEESAFVAMSQELLYEDFDNMNEFFDQIGSPKIKSIAYPYGKFNEMSIAASRLNGYSLGFTVNQGFVYQDACPMALNRIIVLPGTTLEKFKVLIHDNSFVLPEYFDGSVVLRLDSATAYRNKRPVQLDTAAAFVDGKFTAPLNFFVKNLGWNLLWDSNSHKVTKQLTNQTEKWFTVPTYLAGEQVMVPVRELAEAMGYEVIWHQDDKTVEIK